jgi:acyl-CoA dehydrogenase
LCALRERLAYHCGMLDVMFVMQGLGSYSLARAGKRELCERTLPRVAAGELVAAFALTEASAGSDLGRIETRAERHLGRWRLRGAKTFISNAGIASFYTVLARTSGEPGDGGRGSLTMFFVPGDARGLGTKRFEVTAPHPIGEVAFDGTSWRRSACSARSEAASRSRSRRSDAFERASPRRPTASRGVRWTSR